MRFFYITYLKSNNCRSYLIENSKVALNDWYKEYTNIDLTDELYERIVEYCGYGCTWRDLENHISIAITLPCSEQ